jgi:predicted DNA-binding transcriptional regulator YafY
MRDMTVTDEMFAERSLQPGDIEEPSTENQKQDITLKLRIKSEMAYRVLDEFSADVDEQDADGNYIVTVCRPESNWAFGTILSFGEFIEVLEPEHIRETIRDKARKIFQQYS